VITTRFRISVCAATLLTVALTLASGTVASLHAQVPRVYDFLRFYSSARSAGMAGTFLTVTGDAAAMHDNPAALSTIDTSQVAFTFFKHLLDINSGSLQLATNWEEIGHVGIEVDYTNYGSFDRTSKLGQVDGDFGAGDLAFSVGWASDLGEGFKAGIVGKAIFNSIADSGSSALALDAGLLYVDTASRLNIGLSILNLGSQISSHGAENEALPLDLRLGVSHELRGLPLLIALNLNRLLDDPVDAVKDPEDARALDRFLSFSVGGEFRISKPIRLRLGWDNRVRQDVPTGRSPGLSGLSAGFGVLVDDYRFDYALNSLSTLGLIHRVTINVKL
jgi:hypothetical protein